MKGTSFGGQRFELSKELEIINFRVFQENHLDDGTKRGTAKHWISDDTKPENDGKNKMKDQFTSFQKAMSVVVLWGQCLGLNPVTGILQKDLKKMRFTMCSFKFLLAMIMVVAQTIETMLSLFIMFKNPKNISGLAFITFFTTTWLTTIIFIRVAQKWPQLMKELIKSRLDEYVHPNVVKRCKITCVVFMGMGLTIPKDLLSFIEEFRFLSPVFIRSSPNWKGTTLKYKDALPNHLEHMMSIMSRIAKILECQGDVANVGEVFIKTNSSWLFELNVPYTVWLGVIVQYLNSVATATWNYTDIFIMCISLYLTSILEQINKKIVLTANKNFVPARTWSVLREDYTRATNLVQLFDDVFSGIVLVAFASDLFFLCLQLYVVLAYGVKSTQIVNNLCPGHESSPLRANIYAAYQTYSTIFLCVRFLTVTLVASGVNTASKVPVRALYAVPTTSYSKEVERFQNQVNGDSVALSGLHFFYITRELVLTVVGTIVTYELVLLQFGIDNK